MPQSPWHIITCEYPPRTGGVADYTRLVAEGLAAGGDSVQVWCPADSTPPCVSSAFAVHSVLGRLRPGDLGRADKALSEFPSPRRLLVQWVPHGYGYRSMNLLFCIWLWKRARVKRDIVEIMVHEPFLAFGEGSWKQELAAVVHRLMAVVLMHAASRVWVSIPAWADRLRPYFLGRQVAVHWLPVPSNVVCGTDSTYRYNPSAARLILGHFGTFGKPIIKLLTPLIQALLQGRADREFLLMGRGSEEFRNELVRQYPVLEERIQGTGDLPAADLSRAILRCDLLIQPYPDGVSGRRGTAMAALCHGRPMVTTMGRLSEEVWSQSHAVALVPAFDCGAFVEVAERLLANTDERVRLGSRARAFYLEHFDIQQTITVLRSGAAPESLLCAS